MEKKKECLSEWRGMARPWVPLSVILLLNIDLWAYQHTGQEKAFAGMKRNHRNASGYNEKEI